VICPHCKAKMIRWNGTAECQGCGLVLDLGAKHEKTSTDLDAANKALAMHARFTWAGKDARP
jgi:transcription initiation factor TFIIIB Brf1 subunit/transcription initiation factor TFIIB